MRLYFEILGTQNKHKEVVELVEGRYKDSFRVETDRKRLLLSCFVKLKEWKQCRDITHSLLSQTFAFSLICSIEPRPDEWKTFQVYLESVKQIVSSMLTSESVLHCDEAELELKQMRTFINNLVAAASTSANAIRSPFLAQIECHVQFSNDKDHGECPANFVIFMFQTIRQNF